MRDRGILMNGCNDRTMRARAQPGFQAVPPSARRQQQKHRYHACDTLASRRIAGRNRESRHGRSVIKGSKATRHS
jgi:hypothetical protein